jgi:hypothetical protein
MDTFLDLIIEAHGHGFADPDSDNGGPVRPLTMRGSFGPRGIPDRLLCCAQAYGLKGETEGGRIEQWSLGTGRFKA